MKILWFTNILMPEFAKFANIDTRGSGGWMSGLLSAFRRYASDIELSIAFSGWSPMSRKIDDVTYYSLGERQDNDFNDNVIACLNAVKPDVVHIHGAETIAQWLPDEVYEVSPTVLSIQGILEGVYENWNGGIGDDVFRRFSNPILKICGYKSQYEKYLDDRISRPKGEIRVCSKICNFIGRTVYDKTWVERNFPLARYFYGGECLREEFYSEINRKEIVPHSIFCSSAMTYPLKGGHLLIEAFAEVIKKFPDAVLRVPMSAHIPPSQKIKKRLARDAYQRYLWNLVKRFGVQDKIVFLPKLSAEEVCAELDKTDIFCLSSLNENSPNSLCEAQMRGVPCVAFNVGGVSSFVEDGNTGLFANATNAHALADAMIKILEAKNKVNIGMNGYNVARRRHDKGRIINDLVAIYTEVLHDRCSL